MAPPNRPRVQIQRLDAAQNLWLQQELEAVDKTNYEELVPGVLARTYFPTITDVQSWQNVYTYKMFKHTGRAKIQARVGVTDAPRVQLQMTPASRNIKPLQDSYGWTVADIERAAGTNTPLDRMTAMAAKAILDRKCDDLLGLGDSALDIEGALNITGVTPGTAVSKTSGTDWLTNVATDPAKIIGDISKMATDVWTALKQTDAPGFQKFVILVPTAAYGAIATTPRSANSDTTILQFVLKSNPWLEAIEPWFQCDAAGAMGVGRAMIYPRNPLWGGALVPTEFRSLPPQEVDFEVKVPCETSCGGIVCRYPVATGYLDGV